MESRLALRGGPLGLLLLVLSASQLGCVTSGQIKITAGVVSDDLDLARDQGARKCAPRELARGESHLAFTEHELAQGNWYRAKHHIDLAEVAAKEAVQLSRGCKKKILLKEEDEAPPPPTIVKIEEGDRDGDGILDNDDRCPEEPEDKDEFEDADGCPDLDDDKDGIPDTDDQCRLEPEDPDGFNDADGCPDTDNDADGIPDAEDRCPVTPGVIENQGCPLEAPTDTDGDGIIDPEDQCPTEPGPRDNRGCPWADRDADGIKDNVDRCPDDREDADKFEDDDGCPEFDNDGDNIPDLRDSCPMEVGIPEAEGCPPRDRDADGIPDHQDACPDKKGIIEEKGCPKKYKLVELTAEKIEIKEKVFFQSGKWRILPRSFPLLTQVAMVLKDNPEIRIRIEGHTDSQGKDAYNLRLSQNRADSVRTFLLEQGVPPENMISVGYGETQPVASNRTARGRESNRRVEFNIIDDGEE